MEELPFATGFWVDYLNAWRPNMYTQLFSPHPSPAGLLRHEEVRTGGAGRSFQVRAME